MLRFLSRFVGLWLVAASIVAAVVDGAKSIAASSLVLTPVSETWAAIAALGTPSTEPAEMAALPWPLDVLVTWLSSAPTVAVLAAPGFLLLVAGRRRRRFSLSREYAT